MPPEQQPPSFPPQQPAQPANSQYEFIMNPEQPKRPSPLKGGGLKPILFLVAAATVVIILFVVVFSLLSGGGKGSESFIKLAQEQQEIARVANLQYPVLVQQNTKDFAISSHLTMTADNATLLKYLSSHGVKVSKKKLAQGTDSTTDTTLTSALATSTLDPTLVKILRQELTNYQGTLKQAYSTTSSKSARAMLSTFNTNAQLLLTQSQE